MAEHGNGCGCAECVWSVAQEIQRALERLPEWARPQAMKAVPRRQTGTHVSVEPAGEEISPRTPPNVQGI